MDNEILQARIEVLNQNIHVLFGQLMDAFTENNLLKKKLAELQDDNGTAQD